MDASTDPWTPHDLCPSVSLRVFTVREGEGSRGNLRGSKAPTRKILEYTLVKTLRARHSQCRGRGFESLHLHQRPSSEGQGGIPKKIRFSGVSLRVFTCLYRVHVTSESGTCELAKFL